MSADKQPMIGRGVSDPKRNSATAKHVNDRLRRRSKRVERSTMKRAVANGTYCVIRVKA